MKVWNQKKKVLLSCMISVSYLTVVSGVPASESVR